MHSRKKAAAGILLAAAAVIVILAVNAAAIWSYQSVDETRDADCAIVLGAGSWKGEVSPVFRERLNHAIDLYQSGEVGKLILTGGYAEGNDESDAHAAMLYCVKEGVPEKDILLEEKSTVTSENLLYAKQIMEKEDFESALVVSDPLHMKRAMTLAKDLGIDAYSSPTQTSKYTSLKTKLPFLGKEECYFIIYNIYRMLGRVSLLL